MPAVPGCGGGLDNAGCKQPRWPRRQNAQKGLKASLVWGTVLRGAFPAVCWWLWGCLAGLLPGKCLGAPAPIPAGQRPTSSNLGNMPSRGDGEGKSLLLPLPPSGWRMSEAQPMAHLHRILCPAHESRGVVLPPSWLQPRALAVPVYERLRNLKSE